MQGMFNLLRHIVFSFIIFYSLTPGAFAALKSKQFTLSNGLEVIVVPNTKAPAISHTILYKAGAIDEAPGKSGLAHFLEHLMFKGTASFPSGTFSPTISQAGGDDNAFTTFDYTGYYENISRDKLELVMRMEADRMQNLAFTPADVEKEREVILEERRSRVDNSPGSQLQEQLAASLYLNHPYHRPLIGWLHEMARLSPEDAMHWYRTYYKPNNAILVVSGDVTAEELKPLAEKYYGIIPRGDIPARTIPSEPPALVARRLSLIDSRVANNEFYRYYLAPSQLWGETKHSYALTVLASLLGSGQTSRLYQTLVQNKKLATSANSYYDDVNIGPSCFVVHAVAKRGKSLEAIESAMNEVIQSFITTPVPEEDLLRVKKNLVADAIYAQEDLKTLAYIYGQALASGLTVDYVEHWQDHINAVTAKDVQDAARYVFNPSASVTGYLQKTQEDK